MSEENGYVTREEMLAPSERRLKDLVIAGLGKVQIQSITELERSRAVESPNYGKNGKLNLDKVADYKCRLIVVGLAKPKLGNTDIQALHAKDSQITNDLADAIAEHCGISAADLEALEKNSGATADASLPLS